MDTADAILFSCAYLGPASYFACLARAEHVLIESKEHYIKQTYRNRCRIMTANGVLNLTIPVIKVNGNHTSIRNIEISYHEKWQQLHWRAITAAYQHSPYFMFYEDALKPFYTNHFKSLLAFNLELTKTILDLIGIEKEIKLTNDYYKNVPDGIKDLRDAFSPKVPLQKELPPYIQVFAERHEFQQDLSILDVLLNLGPETSSYLYGLSNS
ncbi:MAG: WbqC family protein [Bacteroidetes bacterium]|nr:WbqC family protein [Bacteroidota bacterium]